MGTTDGTSLPTEVAPTADASGGEAGDAHPGDAHPGDAHPGDAHPGEARTGDPAERELAAVTEAMAEARAGVPPPTDTPALPDDDEVAGLERAHEALRATLDRVDRGG